MFKSIFLSSFLFSLILSCKTSSNSNTNTPQKQPAGQQLQLAQNTSTLQELCPENTAPVTLTSFNLEGDTLYISDADCQKIAAQASNNSLGLFGVGVRVNGSAFDDLAAAAAIFNRNGGKDIKGSIAELEAKKRNTAVNPSTKTEGIESYEFKVSKNLQGGVTAVSSINSLVDKGGTLTFTVEANPETGVRGWEMLDTIFQFHGNSIKKIDGTWCYETNLDMFKTAVDESLSKLGKTLDDLNPSELDPIYKAAAKKTWTAQQVSKKGFSEVENVNVTVWGGGIFEAIATFTRPSA